MTAMPLKTGAINRYHLLVFVGCWLGGIFDGMDSTLMSIAMPVALKEMLPNHPEQVGQIASYVTSIFLVGWMLGGFLFGWVGDKLGRIKSMLASIIIYAVFTGLAGFAHTWPQLAICRFLTGLGIGGELVSISTFLTEVWPGRSRAVAVGLLITSYQAGVFIAGGINTLVDSWRVTFWIGALPALLVFFLRGNLQESDQWVTTHQKIASSPEKQQTYWKTLLSARYKTDFIIGSLAFGGLLIGYWASLSWIPLWLQDMLKTGGQGNERGIATMCQGIAAMAGCSMAGPLGNYFGRRTIIVVGSLASLFASLLLFLTNTVFSPVIYYESALLGYCVGLLQAILYVYLPELFPTIIRASAVGACLNIGRLVTAIAVFYVGNLVIWLSILPFSKTLIQQHHVSPYAIAASLFALAYLFSVVAGLLGKETANQALPE
jgi:MFS family permease